MSFDKVRVFEITKRLAELETEEASLIAELRQALGSTAAPVAAGSAKVAAPVPKAAKGELQTIVTKALSTYSTPKSLKDIVAKISRTRPGTRPAAVAAVLAAMAKKGTVISKDDAFYMPPVEANASEAPLAAAAASQESAAAPTVDDQGDPLER